MGPVTTGARTTVASPTLQAMRRACAQLTIEVGLLIEGSVLRACGY